MQKDISRCNGFTSIKLPFSFRNIILATGTEIKSSFAFLIGDTVYISGMFDDLRKPDTFEGYQQAVSGAKKQFGLTSDRIPSAIACDLHPEYISSRFAKDMFEKAKIHKRIRLLEIQHHHAHVAACMAENRLFDKVIGVAFDGTGYGSDGNIWGGEFLLVDYTGFDRLAHIAYVPMPGADMAVVEPQRMAFSYLYETYNRNIDKLKLGVLRRIGKSKYSLFSEMIEKDINSPLTSSAGRLFDAVSSMIGIRDRISYEGEAAIELERIASTACSDIYKFEIGKIQDEIIIKFWPMIKAIILDLRHKKPLTLISRKFHNTLAEAIKEVCSIIRKKTKINDVALSGGVFQNRILLYEAKRRLENANFSVFTHLRTSCADKSLSLGQAVIAAHRVERSQSHPSTGSGHFDEGH